MDFGIGAIIQLILWILGFVMERARLTIEQKENYYKFIQNMSEYGLGPAKHKKIAMAQLQKLKERLDEKEKGKS